MIRTSFKSVRKLAGTAAFIAVLISVVLFSFDLVATPSAHAAGAYAPADSPGTLAVVRQTVDIDYGNKISITAVVDSGSRPVESVRALFRPRGGSTIWSYYYPEFVIDGELISVSFEIATGPGSYHPTGIEFETEIELTHPEGDISIAVSPELVEYLDPDKDWKRTDGDGYTIVYYGISDSDVNKLIATVNSRIPTLKNVLGVTDAPDFPHFKAVVFPSIRDATPSFPPVSQTATDQFLFAGFAQPEYWLFVQGQLNATTFTHELAHLYTDEVISSSLNAGIPSWLGEGLARFLETGSSSSSNARLRSSVRPDEFLALRHMQTIPGQRSDVFIFYPQAGAFVGYLVEEYAAGSMGDFLAAINSGQSLLLAFEEVYGKSLYEMENDWRANFEAAPLAIPSVTPEPAEPSEESSPRTPIPLVNFSVGSSGASDSAGDMAATGVTGTTAPVFLPTVTPQNSGNTGTASGGSATGTGSDSNPNYVIAILVVALLVFAGIWLFIARRSKLPKRKSSG